MVSGRHRANFMHDAAVCHNERRRSALTEQIDGFHDTGPYSALELVKGLAARNLTIGVVQIFLKFCFGFRVTRLPAEVAHIQSTKILGLMDGSVLDPRDNFGCFGCSLFVGAEDMGYVYGRK